MGFKRLNLTKLREITKDKTGMELEEFVVKEFKVEYKTFLMRLRKRRLLPSEALCFCLMFEMKCDDLFGLPYKEAILFQGKYEYPEIARKLWDKAPNWLKASLVDLPWAPPDPVVEPPKAVPVIKNTKAPAEKQEDVEFFIDTDKRDDHAPEKSAPAAQEDDEMFIETY